MEHDLEQYILDLEKKLHQEGLGLMLFVDYLLLTPEEALIFLEEVSSINIDLAILGTTLWDRNEDGDYYESPNIFHFDKVQRDEIFVDYTYRETKTIITLWVGDPTIDRLRICFEGKNSRQRRLEQIEKNKE